jgi:tetratricopeptide (TPR) repeat protein
MWKRGTELANTALRLDPTLADAHNALGWLKMYFEYDWPGAAKAYRRALELNPSLADAHHGYAHYLMISGQFDEGFAAGWRALELSPFDRIYMAHDIWALFMARRFGDADRQARSILAADPGNTLARWYSARVYEQLGYFGRVLSEDLSSPAEIARAHALSGSEAEARKILSEMMRNSDTVNAPFGIALVYLSLGDKQSAVDWLERGYERRVYPLPEIARDVRFDSLRSERRFRELLVRMGLT